MEKVMQKVTAIMIIVALFFTSGCNKENHDSDVRVTTYTPQDITQTSAVCGGDVIVTLGLSLNELGVCWSTSCNPTVGNSHISTSNWNEPFVCTLSVLEPGTTYHARAYALRGLEYYYGEDKRFTTKSNDSGGGDNHAYVDLGLPSGLLWATCNVGAMMPEEYGDCFAWGETEPKSVYDWDTYAYGWELDVWPYLHLNKYNTDSLLGLVDNLTTLQPSDDAATTNWGNGWRMPTWEEWNELLTNTTNIWTTHNGVNGRLFTASNGNTLFLPATFGSYSWFDDDNHIFVEGTDGRYWSSSLRTDQSGVAFCNGFNQHFANYDNCWPRESGLSVRPVREH